ncbi:MAG: hypothetical protein JWP67_377 [Mucilaginibacter sp.]|nr:hypothetical protein [Mucilaginibacter sp.]
MEGPNSNSENSQSVFQGISNWFTEILTAGGTIASILALLFPNLGATGKTIAICLAIILGAYSIFSWLKKRPNNVTIQTPSTMNSPAGAILRDLLPLEEGDPIIGRNSDVQTIYTLVKSTAFRYGVVWGQSGCGKTSLLRAGLVPLLKGNNYSVIYFSKPTADPADNISGALKDELEAARSEKKSIIIVVDQFEEFFLTNRTNDSIEPFRAWFERIVNDTSSPVKFLFGIREDFFARLQKISGKGINLTSQQLSVEIENFHINQAREIISASIQADKTDFEPALTNKMLQDLEFDGFIRPAELQLVATYLKRKKVSKLNEYDSEGGAQGILSSYIKNEINRSVNHLIARLVLKAMCNIEAQTKSPLDQTIESLEQIIADFKLKTDVDNEQLRQILSQFIASRIIVETESGKYNLVHDYFALLVIAATEGLETPTEKAERIFKRYIAQFKDDNKVRISYRNVKFIRSNANKELLQSLNGRQLLRKSTITAFLPVFFMVAVLLFPILICYLFLANSYYISTQKSNYPGGSPNIVVRSGHPYLKFMPGFDNITVETGYHMNNLSPDSSGATDAFPREAISGFIESKKNGCSEWIGYITKQMNLDQRAIAYRLLNLPDSAKNNFVKELEVNPSPQTSFSFAAISKGDSIKSHEDVVKFIQKSLNSPLVSKKNKVALYLTLAELGKEGYNTKSLLSIQYLLEYIHKSMDPKNDRFGREVRLPTLALASAAQAYPEIVTPNLVDSLISYCADKKLNAFSQVDVLELLDVFGHVNTTYSEKIVSWLIKFYAQRSSTDGSGWPNYDAAKAACDIARDYPAAVSKGSISILESLLSIRRDAKFNIASIVIPLSILAQANPQALNPKTAAGLLIVFHDKTAKKVDRAACSIALTRLAIANKSWMSQDAINETLDILKGDSTEVSSLKIYAASALADLYEVNPTALGNISEVIENVIHLSADKEALSGITWENRSMFEILSVLGIGKISPVSPTAVNMEVENITKPIYTGDEIDRLNSLLTLAKFAPTLVLAKRKVWFSLNLKNGSDDSMDHDIAFWIDARANYEIFKKTDPTTLFDKLTSLLNSSKNEDNRLIGSYGLFLYCVDRPDSTSKVIHFLKPNMYSPRPEYRIVSLKTLEMLSFLKNIKEVQDDKRLYARNKSKLSQINFYSEPHISFAIRICLEEIERYKKAM